MPDKEPYRAAGRQEEAPGQTEPFMQNFYLHAAPAGKEIGSGKAQGMAEP